MTEKDFSTMKKTLRIIQKVQAKAKVCSMWVHFTNYDDGMSVNVTIFRKDGDERVPFDFYYFRTPKERLYVYNRMVEFINGKEV